MGARELRAKGHRPLLTLHVPGDLGTGCPEPDTPPNKTLAQNRTTFPKTVTLEVSTPVLRPAPQEVELCPPKPTHFLAETSMGAHGLPTSGARQGPPMSARPLPTAQPRAGAQHARHGAHLPATVVLLAFLAGAFFCGACLAGGAALARFSSSALALCRSLSLSFFFFSFFSFFLFGLFTGA